MSKANYTTLVLGTVSTLVFALGMCMCMIEQWHAFTQGVIVGIVGIILYFVTWMVHRSMTGKPAIRFDTKAILASVYGVFAALVFGAGMCLTMLRGGYMVLGIIVGIVGIVLLLGLIPLIKGVK